MSDQVSRPASPVYESEHRGGFVLLGGAATTVLALVGVYLISQAGENVMGWYADYIIPVGSLLVGLVASSGYGIASWVTGTKISGRLLLAVAVLLTVSFFLAKYLEFRLLFPDGATLSDGTAIGFWRYFDMMSRAFAFEDSVTHKPGDPMGMLGYAFRTLEVLGFVGGGVIVPAALRAKPYCDRCKRYKRTSALAWLAASVPARGVFQRSADQRQAHDEAAAYADRSAREGVDAIVAAARASDSAKLCDELAMRSANKRQVQKLPARLVVELVHCKSCRDGLLRVTRVTGQGRSIRRTPLTQAPLHEDVVARLSS